MNSITSLLVLICLSLYQVCSLKLPGPQVYVVTPKSQVDGRSAPFYYHNWKRRMDTPIISTTTTTTEKTPDLIFAEFESSDKNMKSIRKLLEKEKIESKTTTTLRPIYVPDEDKSSAEESNYGLPQPSTEKPKKNDMTDYFAYYNNLYNSGPVYVPPTPTVPSSTTSVITTTTTTTTAPPAMNNVENIWHIIDNEKQDKYLNNWKEEPVSSEQDIVNIKSDIKPQNEGEKLDDDKIDNEGIDENFALPGFGTNPGNGAENESRAIHTENNFRFPYVDLKPFQMKSTKKQYSNNKGGNNNMFNIDSFKEIKNPVRGEVQDTVPMREMIDRFNPAQPYLPQAYGPNSKQSSSSSSVGLPDISVPSAPPSPPVRTVANLVPPPPPLRDSNDFPTPSTYESFPPYAPRVPAPSPAITSYQPPAPPSLQSSPVSAPDTDDSGESDGPPSDLGYRYKPPAPPATSLPFIPTLPPPSQSKPFQGYSYNKPPPPQEDSPPMMDMPEKPDFEGYHYSKPAMPSPPQDTAPPPPPSNDHPSYGPQDAPPPMYQPESDYPELIFNKPNDDMMKSPDFKFHHDHDHDFDDHDHDHYHYHHPTTTTTTEMPRVNRYSYYYLGKKLYYLPLYFSVYFIVYVGALIIKAILRHKIVYPNSWRPNDQTASFFSKRSIDSHLSNENLHEITGRVTRAIANAAEKYISDKNKDQ